MKNVKKSIRQLFLFSVLFLQLPVTIQSHVFSIDCLWQPGNKKNYLLSEPCDKQGRNNVISSRRGIV